MKKLILPLMLLVLIGIIGVASACVTLPEFESQNCNFSYNVHNESEVVSLLNSKKVECSFTPGDINILKDFLVNGYSVIEQTGEEYASFLESVELDNQNRDCEVVHYSAISHRGKWTGTIINESVRIDESGKECPVFKANYCSVMLSILPNILWNDLENDVCIAGEDSCIYKNFTLSNGRKAEIKIMPETASDRAIERLGELNFTVQLKEVGKGNETRAVYEVKAEKEGKLFGLFRVRANVSVEVDAEGRVKQLSVLPVKKPWWAFLARGI